jgi:hypothetical protein
VEQLTEGVECAEEAIAAFEAATGGQDLTSVKAWGGEKQRLLAEVSGLQAEVKEWKARASSAGSQVSVEVLKLIQAGQTDQMKTLLPVVQALTNQHVEPEVEAIPEPVTRVPATVLTRIKAVLATVGTEPPQGGGTYLKPVLEAAERSVFGAVKSGFLMARVLELERQLDVGATPHF